MFTQVYRQEIELDQKLKSEFNKFVDRLLRVSIPFLNSIFFMTLHCK